MNNQDQVKAIAELNGWTPYSSTLRYWTFIKNDEEIKTEELPAYLTSRDAIVPVIEKYRNYAGDIMDYLQDILERNPDQDVSMDAWYALTATPQQLAEALLRATGKWKE